MKNYISDDASTKEYLKSVFSEKHPLKMTDKFYLKLLESFYKEESEDEIIDTDIANNHFYYEELIPDEILKYKTKK